jgi:hypothetical protein
MLRSVSSLMGGCNYLPHMLLSILPINVGPFPSAKGCLKRSRIIIPVWRIEISKSKILYSENAMEFAHTMEMKLKCYSLAMRLPTNT